MKTRNLPRQALCIPFLAVLVSSQGCASPAERSGTPVSNGSSTVSIVSVILSDDFSTDKGWTNVTAGDFYRDTTNEWLSWHVHRSTDERYYIPIKPLSGDVRFEARVKATYWANNCQLYFGLAETLTGSQLRPSWPSGLFVDIGWFGAGVGTRIVPHITYSDSSEYVWWNAEDPATYVGYNMNSWYRIVFEKTGNHWTISLYNDANNQIGQLAGTLPARNGAYQYFILFSPYDGDWPDGDGLFDDLVVESLGKYCFAIPSSSCQGYHRTTPGGG